MLISKLFSTLDLALAVPSYKNLDPLAQLTIVKLSSIHVFKWYNYKNGIDKSKTVNGIFWHHQYNTGTQTSLSIINFYKEYCLDNCGKILYSSSAKIFFSVPLPQAKTTWAMINASRGSYKMTVIEEDKTFPFSNTQCLLAKKLKKTENKEITLKFKYRTSKISDETRENIYQIADQLERHKNTQLELFCFAGNNEAKGKNRMKLSKRRGLEIKKLLIHLGIDPYRIKIIGYAKRYGLLDYKISKEKNYRVECIILNN